MTETSLNPADPRSLDDAKRAAKRLRKQLHDGDADALARFRSVFADRRDPAAATHADCLHVIAREAGAESWPRLKLAVETAALTQEQRIRQLGRAVTNGNFHLVDRLLSLDPGLPDAQFGLQLAFARKDAALAALARDPALATTPIGERLPIHVLCASKIHHRSPEAVDAMIDLLEALLAAGAEVNQGFPAEPGEEHELSPLYCALGHAGNLRLAEALLRHGADPNDNESLYHATELPTLEGVELLFRHGAEVGTTNAFLRMLDRESPEGVRLFLANGADPNAPPYRHPSPTPADDRNALHHAILRGRSGEIGALLLDHGVDPAARHDGRTAYALAVISGNRAMAEMLAARGLDTELTPAERFLAAIADGDGAEAKRLLSDTPSLWNDLTDKDLQRPTELAMNRDSLPVLRLLAELGFDPDRKGESDMPPIHAAAWWGHAEIVEMYIGLGVDLESRNMFGGTALGTAIHGSMNCPGAEEGDYLRCLRALVAAGAKILPEHGHLEMGSEEVTLFLEEHLEELQPHE
ncbi:ankyrin repeat domain-containing protein [Pelagibius sp.]|uniref:ankyrin repeat domain-containing protein n=1 Tax=Pelagibius sp. TaxID=1931238 RepID=UPI002617AE3B|nr:ankyrin repeat domain-containing protein [Pelagibius sp.]